MSAPVVYWDGSAVASALVRRPESERVLAVLREPAVHLVSTLAWVEALAEAARLVRDGALSRELRNAVGDALERGPWRLTYACPRRSVLEDAVAGPYDAATRWHFGTALT
ncbi:MAG: type II toxin-antitoxin system VapC family toxin, partial [Gemmatimonadota bacterium]